MLHRLRTVWCWITTGHTEDEHEWGYEHGSGMVDIFCSDCQRLLRKIPLEESPVKDDIVALVGEAI